MFAFVPLAFSPKSPKDVMDRPSGCCISHDLDHNCGVTSCLGNYREYMKSYSSRLDQLFALWRDKNLYYSKQILPESNVNFSHGM